MGHRRRRRHAARTARGFTLIEMMVTVGIVGVLAVAAYAGYHKFITSSHQMEANSMLSGIKNRQEAYKAEIGAYLNVSSGLAANQDTTNFGALYPQCAAGVAAPGKEKTSWPGGNGCTATCCAPWSKLKVQSTAPTFYGFTTVAGSGSSGLPTISINGNTSIFPVNVLGPWFVATAVADTDGNKVYTTSMISSFDNEIHIDNENE